MVNYKRVGVLMFVLEYLYFTSLLIGNKYNKCIYIVKIMLVVY